MEKEPNPQQNIEDNQDRIPVSEENDGYIASLKENLERIIHATSPDHMAGGFEELVTLFCDLGNRNLAEKSVLLSLKIILDTENKKLNERNRVSISHTLGHTYAYFRDIQNRFEDSGHVIQKLIKDLAELMGPVYEAGGNFQKAYLIYKDNALEKYKEKITETDRVNNISGEANAIFDIPKEKRSFPDFKKLPEEEFSVYQIELFGEYLKTIPEEIITMDFDSEKENLIQETRKIIEEYEQAKS